MPRVCRCKGKCIRKGQSRSKSRRCKLFVLAKVPGVWPVKTLAWHAAHLCSLDGQGGYSISWQWLVECSFGPWSGVTGVHA